MEANTARNLRQCCDDLLCVVREQKVVLGRGDVHAFLELSLKRDFLMEGMGVLSASLRAGSPSGDRGRLSADRSQLEMLLRECLDLDWENGSILSRLLSETKAELETVQGSRAMLHAYGRNLTIPRYNTSLDASI